jgi:hypothetical protein
VLPAGESKEVGGRRVCLLWSVGRNVRRGRCGGFALNVDNKMRSSAVLYRSKYNRANDNGRKDTQGGETALSQVQEDV